MSKLNSEKSRAWIELNMANLRHNVMVLKKCLPSGCELMPAVKADAYGHGATLVTNELSRLGVNAFCVASLKEGITLRENGITGEILILGYTLTEQASLLTQYNLMQTVVDYEYAKSLNKAAKANNLTIDVHIGIDTGMHRLGECCESIDKIATICHMGNLNVKGIFTHLCTDDTKEEKDIEFTYQQADLFNTMLCKLERMGIVIPKKHILSSYGLMNYPKLGGDYARIGIALYGVLSTKEDTLSCKEDLRPVLSLKTRVTSVRVLHKGESAGYGLAYTASRETRIATLAIGYADGLPRALSCGVGRVLIRGQVATIAGRICMDQALVDVTEITGVRTSDIAVIIGKSGEKEIGVCDVAKEVGTISNDVLSGLGSRLERIIGK